MKYARYLAVAIFTFAVGIGISPIRFYPESIACGRNNSSTAYRSSYFVQTSFGYVAYDSEQEASDAFNRRLKRAINVSDVKPKVNKEGVCIKQRAVALFFDQGNKQYYAAVFWRDGRILHSIHSSSFTHVMDFEKHYF
jgi:hypothetical protein